MQMLAFWTVSDFANEKADRWHIKKWSAWKTQIHSVCTLADDF
jgi:hypothetical protein